MQSMELLGLVRFSPSHGVMQPVRLACDRFESLLPQFQAELLHREELQMMFVLGDLNKGLALLRVALDSASLDGFVISGGLAQGIRSRATLASSLAGFTEGSMEMLFEIANTAGPQEIAISPKLSSLIKLAAPDYADQFRPVTHARNSGKVRSPLIMSVV
jgi:hypothetical protein